MQPEPIQQCIQGGPTGWATGQGRVGEQVGNQQVRQKHWPIPWVGTPDIPHRYGVRYEGGGTGGPAPISGNQPGQVEYATCNSPGLKGQQMHAVHRVPQRVSQCTASDSLPPGQLHMPQHVKVPGVTTANHTRPYPEHFHMPQHVEVPRGPWGSLDAANRVTRPASTQQPRCNR